MKSTFMILHWATPVTVNGTPWAVSTISQHGFRVMTSSDNLCTSVTSHQAHAQPPTIVRFFVEPQHPPGIRRKILKIISIIRNGKIFKSRIKSYKQLHSFHESNSNSNYKFNGFSSMGFCWR
jgi:hypothetical protein